MRALLLVVFPCLVLAAPWYVPNIIPTVKFALASNWGETAAVDTPEAFVERAECPAGIVYGTDAAISSKVEVVGTFPENTHKPIVYPIALTTSAKSQAAGFVAYLTGPRGRDIFVKYGFTIPDRRDR